MGADTKFDLDKVLKRHGLVPLDLSRVLGVSMTTVRLWKRGIRKPSIEHCQVAEKKLGIPKHELRPDLEYLWTPPPTGRRKAA